MKAEIKRITDILRRDNGISGAMQYTQQISWILFLKFFDDYEKAQELEATLNGKVYKKLMAPEYEWSTWAAPKKADGKIDRLKAMVGDDLKEFVNLKLFPYLEKFRDNENIDYHSMQYKIGEIFYKLTNLIEDGNILREAIDIIDGMSFQSQQDLFELSQIYEDLLQGMGNDGGNSGEFYTPRPVIKAIVECIQPNIGETVYDGAAGSCGFLIEAYNHLRTKAKATGDLTWLNHDALRGNEKTPLAYTLGVMNMILHGIENPNLNKKNTLVDNIRDFQEKDGFNIILANPPFGGMEMPAIQSNFPIKTNATEMLFLQHFMKKLKTGGRAGIIVPEGVLFNTSNAFQEVKKELLENYNLHTIVSLPTGIFLPYSGVKTNIIFFEKTKPTEEIRYYEVDLGRKLTKKDPIKYEELQEMVKLYNNRETGPKSWIVKVEDIKDYDLSAKNPNGGGPEPIEEPRVILDRIQSNNEEIQTSISNLNNLL